MTVLLRNLPVGLDHSESDLAAAAAEFLGLERVEIHTIIRKSLDARRRRRPQYLYTLAVDLSPRDEADLLAEDPPRVEDYCEPETIDIPLVPRPGGPLAPVVVGSGPAGLFAAYRLVQAGLNPVVIERGLEVTERTRQWNAFLKRGAAFNPESNLLFGEGGAGAYSDGKLYTRVKDPRVAEVLGILADHGAPREILYDAKPHIGSNLLPSVIRRFRATLLQRGAEFRFSTRMTGLRIDGGGVCGIDIEPGGTLETDRVFLGLGHSARDTLRSLHALGIAMEQKPFQIGARIEHPQHVINRMQYGSEYCADPALPPADYRLVAKIPGGDVFSFCMCPGGEILPATEKPGSICVNGASPLGRRGRFANSGFVVTLTPTEFVGSGALAGIELQEEIEGRAAALAEHPFGAPALRLGDFVAGRLSTEIPESSYPLALTPAPFEEFLPPRVHDALRRGLSELCSRLRILRHPDAIIVGPESRSSCPVRVLRDRITLESPSAAGLYPMGEGAGHAGGIMSAAIDGMRCAESHIRQLAG